MEVAAASAGERGETRCGEGDGKATTERAFAVYCTEYMMPRAAGTTHCAPASRDTQPCQRCCCGLWAAEPVGKSLSCPAKVLTCRSTLPSPLHLALDLLHTFARRGSSTTVQYSTIQ